ncbi:MAG TPA: hypothetical protein VFP84_04185 [Kofleriaceae bacterium]|nr:hypothetical protein [Kofleriaceae bacterium]
MSRFSIAALAAALAMAACGGAKPPASTLPPAVAAELSAALVRVAWWLGDWTSDGGRSSEHWVAAGGAIYGVALHDKTFEVIVIDDSDAAGKADGALHLYAMLEGKRSTEFRQRTIGDATATFFNNASGEVKTITYQRGADGAGYVERFDGAGSTLEFPWHAAEPARAADLEAADRAFAAATAARGADGWTAAFDPEGGMMAGDERVEHDGVGAAMAPLLSTGTLAWAPIASGRAGALGYTVGKATFTGKDGAVVFRTSYVTIWRQQEDGSWKVLFDTGRRS